MVCAISPETACRVTIDLVAPGVHQLGELLVALRLWLGLKSAPVVAVPVGLARLTGKAADGLAWLGWRSPMRSTAVEQLGQGVVGGPTSHDLPGVRLSSLHEILAQAPSGVQERWFARMYFCKPLALGALVLFWTASGLIGLLRRDAASDLLVNAGLPHVAALACVVGGGLVDVLLGLAVCVRRFAPTALRAMLLVCGAYLLGATIWRPDLWADPLGPFLKIVPAMVLVCLVLAIMDER